MNSLKHHFLIAMPQMADAQFAQSLTYLIEHNEQGAMGLIINKPCGLTLADIFEQLRPEQPPHQDCSAIDIYSGGPVQSERGFVLHSPDARYKATLELDELALTTSQDILLAIADGTGPAHSLICLGYAGWGAGQLEQELADNAWLTCPFDAQVLFACSAEQRLTQAAANLGVNLDLLARQAGHA